CCFMVYLDAPCCYSVSPYIICCPSPPPSRTTLAFRTMSILSHALVPPTRNAHVTYPLVILLRLSFIFFLSCLSGLALLPVTVIILPDLNPSFLRTCCCCCWWW
ncbi:hypothetical protein RSAG8_08829, partial [Rhizoctonia solani AG-8 WAC10335]